MSELKAGICISRMSAYAPHVKCVVVQLYILLGAVWGPVSCVQSPRHTEHTRNLIALSFNETHSNFL